jgi:GH24 family phage-related lysozyme (muramidase)
MKQITQNQFDASVSFIFNLGCSTFTNIASNINSGDLDTATDSWLTFNHVGGAVSPVLTRRRAIEVNLFKS